MKKLNLDSMSKVSGGNMPELVIIYEALDAWCGVQRAYVGGELISMRLICD